VTDEPPRRTLGARWAWAEDVVVILVAAVATLIVEWTVISKPRVFQTDAMIHEFWMRRFQDPALFHDPLTNALLETGYSPPLFRSLYWLASYVVDPVHFGELLPVVLQPLAVWLVFRIVREQVAWRPAAWLGAALFLVPWDIHRFSGGHPRAFAQPIVLLAVLFLLRRWIVAAAIVPPVGVLLYPPAGITALGVVLLAAITRRRSPLLDRRRAALAGLSVLGVGAATLLARVTTGYAEVITASEAHHFPEFGEHGQMHFFASSTIKYLSQNYSGFSLLDSGSILAVSALLLLLVRPRNAKLIRWEVWCMAIAALVLFAIAHAVLFRLYLPHRYTYPLLPFFCIVVAVCARPTVEALGRLARAALLATPVLPVMAVLLALTVFPLGPRMSLADVGSWLADAAPALATGLAVGILLAAVLRPTGPDASTRRTVVALAAAATLVAGSVLVAAVAFAGGGASPYAATCKEGSLYRFLAGVPKDAIVAADPFDANCIPIAARRPVVISRKLYQPWALDYFEQIRGRMFRTVDAFYGPSVDDVNELATRYGADYLLVRRGGEPTWFRMAPFTQRAERLRRKVTDPAIENLPERCVVWQSKRLELYDLSCIGSETAS
jgi:hypothetical protein